MYVKDPLQETAWGPFATKDQAIAFIKARPDAILFLRPDRPAEVRTVLPPPEPEAEQPR